MSEPSRRRDRVTVLNALLGLVALGLFAGALALTWFFLHGGFQSGVPVSAVFSGRGVGQQLRVGGDVKIRGVLVGRIRDVDLGEDGKARLDLLIDDDLEIPADAVAEIRSKTVFGEKWVELIPPAASRATAFLTEGSVIPDERTKEPLELERSLQLGHDLLSRLPLRDLTTVFSTLAEGFTGSEDYAAQAIDRGIVALRAVNVRSDELDLALVQLRQTAEWLDANDGDIVSFMESLDDANRALVGAGDEYRASLQSVPLFLDELATFQERIEPDLGRLVEDGANVAEIVAARAGELTDIVVQLQAFTTVWNSGLKQPCEGLYESDLTCWQVYQSPGLESRGLYGGGTGPLGDSANDPLAGMTARVSDATFTELVRAYTGRDVPPPLARVLYEPMREALPELVGGGL
ncbi:MAG: MCE family protein [Actinomycetota bacterium]|nr:MCE family protein [Actinomycetota bacterium]MDQ3951904.1 MCE family protein [Actinomycetota bacterium]